MKFYDIIMSFFTPIIKFIGKIGLPKRKITGKDYYKIRDSISIGTVLLTKTRYELSNLINPAKIKHAAIYVGKVKGDGICYVLEAVGKGVVLTDLVSFLLDKDYVVGMKPNFIREDKKAFEHDIQRACFTVLNIPYDYLFSKGSNAFYCFELCAYCFISVYSEISFKCKEIVKGKRIYDENTFLDEEFFEELFKVGVL